MNWRKTRPSLKPTVKKNMTLKTHALLATAATAVLIALIYYRSNGNDDARLKKVMEKAKDLQTTVTAKPVSKVEKQKLSELKEEEKKVISGDTGVQETKKTETPVPEKESKPNASAPAKESKPSSPAVVADSDDFLPSQNIVRNGSFKEGFKGWRYWSLSEELGKELVKIEEDGLSLKGQLNKMMGIAQAVKITSGTVYQISAKVRSVEDAPERKSFMGARLALNAPGQKEMQLVWLYKNGEWEEKKLSFTNRFTGFATFFFHTGYTTNAATCLVKDISLIPENKYPKANTCSSNGDFKNDLKGWSFWQVSGTEGSNLISRISKDEDNYVQIKGQSGNRLIGLSQAVGMVSGKVYRITANVKSQDEREKTLFGARVALYAPNQKEQQLVWTYNTKGWETKQLVFTNYYSGAATLYFHTGYTTNACTAMFKDLSLVRKR